MIGSTRKAALTAAASSLALASGALAQGAAAQDAQPPQEGRAIEVITVTAQQREQSLQDVPVAVGAYDMTQLENAGVRDIKDLISISPGLMVTSTQSETITTARIRGVGTVGDNFGLESSVGVYIDGVFRARNGVGFGDLGELERIEVLRGPQGTLFGKNTSAGVLNIITQGPDLNQYGGEAAVSVGNYNLARFEAGVTGPIVENQLGFRLFGVVNERDGFTDLVIGKGADAQTTESENQDYYSLRGQLLWTPNDRVSGRIIADYSDRDELCCSGVQWDFTPQAAGLVQAVGGQVLNPADPDQRLAFANREYLQEVEDWGISGEFDFDFDFGTLTSITAYRDWSNRRSQDIDYSSADIAYRAADNNFTELERFSQEFRLNGQAGDIDWMVGAFYSQEDLQLGDGIQVGEDWEPFLGLAASGSAGLTPSPTFITDTLNTFPGVPTLAPGTALPAGTGVNQDVYDQSATSWAIFTHNTWQVTDRFALTGGLRYTNEEKEIDASFDTNQGLGCTIFETAFGLDPLAGSAGTPAAGLAPLVCLPYQRSGLDFYGYDRSRTDEEISGTLRTQYDLTDQVMVFAGYSRGFKAGGFNLDRVFNGPIDANGYSDVDPSFAPETISAWEAGFKSRLAGDALQLNANVFFQTIDDYQLNTFNGIAFVVQSVEESESYGAELDFLFLTPIDGLDITGGYAYVNTEYKDVNTGDALVDAIEGKAFSLSPEHFINGAITYERPVFDGYMFRTSLDGRWVSSYNTGSDLDPEKEQDGFATLNGRIGVGREDERWMLELWGRNLTDETYAQVAFDAFAQGSRTAPGTSNDPRGTAGYDAFLAAPRTWGVTLRSRW